MNGERERMGYGSPYGRFYRRAHTPTPAESRKIEANLRKIRKLNAEIDRLYFENRRIRLGLTPLEAELAEAAI